MTVLIQINQAQEALMRASSIQDVLGIKNKAEAIRSVLKQVGASLQVQNTAATLKLMSERKAGTMLAVMEKNGGSKNVGNSGGTTMVPPDTLEDLGITRNQSSRYQSEAKIDAKVFEQWIADANAAEVEITQAGLLKVARGTHVSNNAGNNEWYTPAVFIAAATSVMGGIDLDPASSRIANASVKAKRFYSVEDDGLTKTWKGRVWLNPPYAQPWIAKFSDKLAESVSSGAVSQAIVLVNNATETEWWQRIAATSSAVCFPKTRVKFLDPEGNPGAPLQGQSVIYCGDKPATFVAAFADFGKCWQS